MIIICKLRSHAMKKWQPAIKSIMQLHSWLIKLMCGPDDTRKSCGLSSSMQSFSLVVALPWRWSKITKRVSFFVWFQLFVLRKIHVLTRNKSQSNKERKKYFSSIAVICHFGAFNFLTKQQHYCMIKQCNMLETTRLQTILIKSWQDHWLIRVLSIDLNRKHFCEFVNWLPISIDSNQLY